MTKVRIKDLMVGEDFQIPEVDGHFCFLGLNEDGDATYTKIEYLGPRAVGNNIFSDDPELEVIYVPRSFQVN